MATIRITDSPTGDDDCIEDCEMEHIPRIGETIRLENFPDTRFMVTAVEHHVHNPKRIPSILVRVIKSS